MMSSLERARRTIPFWEEAGLRPGARSEQWLADVLDLLEGRGQTFRELAEYTDYFLTFEVVKRRYAGEDIDEDRKGTLRSFFSAMLSFPAWEPEELEVMAKVWCGEKGLKMKDVAMPLRWALTGRKVSPGIFHVAIFLGRDEVRKRLAYYDLV
jgi:glutamyl-tRNA synthetase